MRVHYSPHSESSASASPYCSGLKPPSPKALMFALLLSLNSILPASADSNSTQPTVTQLFNVKTVKAKEIESAKTRTYYGFIRADESRVFDLSPRFGGFIETLYVDKQYAKVGKGEKLAQVYSPEVYKAKEEYLNSLNFNARRSSPGMLKSARIKLELLGLPESEIDTIARTKRSSTLTTIVSSASGWVFEKRVNDGSAFKAGTKLFRIVDLDKVWLEAKIYQKELPLLEHFAQFKVKATGVQKQYDAKKLLLYPSLDPKEATATLRLEIDNAEGKLKPGMYATITASAATDKTLVIPRTAAIRKNGRWFVFLASEYEGEYEPAEISLKPLDNRYYQVTEGLSTGDEVVNNALFMMDSDAQINGLY